MIPYWTSFVQSCGVIRVRSILRVTISKRQTFQFSSMKRKHNEEEISFAKRLRGTTMATATVVLTPRESQLRNLLLDVANFVNESKDIEKKVELRWAGGWVRDKLLGIQSHDIDIAINVMTGQNFGLKVREYLEDAENLKKHGLEAKDVKKLYKIAANPEKSKQLETATTNIFQFDVDFVNLRKETYTEDSRNPEMEFGTAEEDALRRDATINALFYNLHTDILEDFTGGLADMKAKLIKTPLEPYTTFKDDPLRVLRLIRFASRLDFKIDSEAEDCMSNPAIMEALRLKISRERVGVEVEKMLKGNNPWLSLNYFDRLGIYSTIFTDPTAHEIPAPDTSSWRIVYDCLKEMTLNETPDSIYKSLVRSDDAKYLAWILAALAPWTAIPPAQAAKPGGKTPPPYGALVAREGLKAESKLCNMVAGAFKQYAEITELKDAIKRNDSYVHERDTVGMMIRKWESHGGQWKLQVLFALLVESLKLESSEEYRTLFSEWQKFIDHLKDLDVMEAPAIRGIVDGKILSKALGVKPGIWMAPALNVCMEWQLRNPDSTDTEAAIEEVRKRKEELNIPQK
ncbi:Bccca1 [Botrytis cinerea B05.10]|uniref:Bccca1 n=3 Tax=Botryotinia fuckeliana TaxID=40559 RepID=A0A384JYW9_BOTFB|nr:Bccca1 [Botrytis cinerea B05.10]ATZ55574.1 Bccca1 [Botrytis cinerea B05.10]